MFLLDYTKPIDWMTMTLHFEIPQCAFLIFLETPSRNLDHPFRPCPKVGEILVLVEMVLVLLTYWSCDTQVTTPWRSWRSLKGETLHRSGEVEGWDDMEMLENSAIKRRWDEEEWIWFDGNLCWAMSQELRLERCWTCFCWKHQQIVKLSSTKLWWRKVNVDPF